MFLVAGLGVAIESTVVGLLFIDNKISLLEFRREFVLFPGRSSSCFVFWANNSTDNKTEWDSPFLPVL
jgi:hypothetical protein